MSLSLPFSPESAGDARAALESWLRHHAFSDEVVQDSQLIVSELVANAIRHAAPLENGRVLVRWRRDGEGVLLSVSDGGGGDVPTVVSAQPDAERGRGLAIIDALSPRWWVERSRRIQVTNVYLPVT